MAWSERQIALLREIGVPVWLPAVPASDPSSAPRPLSTAAPAAASAHGPGSAGAAAPAPVPAPVPQAMARPAPVPEPPAAAAMAPAAVDRAHVAGLDWDGLRAAVAGCTACGLCQTRRQTVFGVGHPRAHWMVVGEAPGEQEDLRGEPFVGAAGQLLDRMLAALGLTRAEQAAEGAPRLEPAHQVYIANTLKCRPPRNRNPEPAEMAQCEPFLIRQIELLQPRVILAMGRFAVQALLRTDEAIGKLRGRVHRYQGVPLVVTYHPAYLLRNPADKAKAWDDLCLAAATMAALETAAR